MRDPNRLMMILKERHINLNRLKIALKESKADNAGDCFKLNRLIKFHEDGIKQLEQELKESIQVQERKYANAAKDAAEEDRMAAVRIRLTLKGWTFGDQIV